MIDIRVFLINGMQSSGAKEILCENTMNKTSAGLVWIFKQKIALEGLNVKLEEQQHVCT